MITYKNIFFTIKNNNSFSTIVQQLIGIKQGCTLSPLMFNLYFNDEFIKKINLNDIFLENSYHICISTRSKEYNDKIYEAYKFSKIITNEEKKIGKFKKYELIFNIEQIPF